MGKFSKEQKKDIMEEVFYNLEDNIKKTKISQCKDGHSWRKLNDTEIACTICPTIHIVERADDYF